MMLVNHYDYNDSTQLSPHFNIREFRCQCGNNHETLISSELVDKLEALYAALNCSKIIVTSGYRCPDQRYAVRLRIWALLESLTLQVVISTHT